MEQARRDVELARETHDQLAGRHAFGVGHRKGLAGERRRRQRRLDRADGVADVEQGAAIVDPAERQPALGGDRVQQSREVALDAGTVGQRQAQHDAFDRSAAAGLPEHVLGVGLAVRVRVLRCGGIAGAKRLAGKRGLTVHLDRAREHDAPHAGLQRGIEQAARHVHVGDDERRRVARVAGGGDVRASGEMDDRVDAGQHRCPVGGGEVAQRDDVARWRPARWKRAHCADVRHLRGSQSCAQRPADEPVGAGDQQPARIGQ